MSLPSASAIVWILELRAPSAGSLESILTKEEALGRRSFHRRDGRSRVITSVGLWIFLLQKVWNEPLQETANEADDQHHLPGQGARLKIGLSDLEPRDDAGGE